jgi:hypothetical protein
VRADDEHLAALSRDRQVTGHGRVKSPYHRRPWLPLGVGDAPDVGRGEYAMGVPGPHLRTANLAEAPIDGDVRTVGRLGQRLGRLRLIARD